MTMTRFAPVAPPRILREMSNAGPYHLILAHDVLRTPEEYDLYFGNSMHGWQAVILDNSITELGSAVDVKVIEEAARISHATVIVLPDVYYEGKATAEACAEALLTWPHSLISEREVMYVPQGRTMAEWARSAQELAEDSTGIHWWGIPRNLVGTVGTRMQAINIACMLNPRRKIHLLGFSDNLIDDMLCARHPQVTGIDSAVPLRIASLDIKLKLDLDEIPKRGTWFEDAPYLPEMDENVAQVREWIR